MMGAKVVSKEGRRGPGPKFGGQPWRRVLAFDRQPSCIGTFRSTPYLVSGIPWGLVPLN
jgi:hypothetical protein